jgi:hypothetical protein
MEKRKFLTLPGLELRPLYRRSQSLYGLRYRGSSTIGAHVEKKKVLLMQQQQNMGEREQHLNGNVSLSGVLQSVRTWNAT